MFRLAAPLFALLIAPAAQAETFRFPSVDGGVIDTAQWAGQPILVVNTASFCGFAPQYRDMQTLSDDYAGRAVVLAVLSDDFNQEADTGAEAKEFCELTYGIDLPMTDILHVTGSEAHDFYKWVKAQTGFAPGWNFNKVLIGADGAVLGTWGSPVSPTGGAIRGAIDAALSG